MHLMMNLRECCGQDFWLSTNDKPCRATVCLYILMKEKRKKNHSPLPANMITHASAPELEQMAALYRYSMVHIVPASCVIAMHKPAALLWGKGTLIPHVQVK